MHNYKELDTIITGNFSDHPEVIASKAFALACYYPKSSEEVVNLYGLALEEREDVDWMYGQFLAMEKEMRLPGKYDDASVRNLEKKLRKVVDKHPSHYQAMISLAKRLVLNEAFEEAEDYITKTQAEAKTEAIDKSATKLEMLGSVYQRGCMSKLYTN